jgi:hypothetical protein
MKPGKLPQRFRSGRGCEKQQLKFAAAEAADPWRLRLERVRGKVDLYEEGRIPGANQRILPPAAYASLSLSHSRQFPWSSEISGSLALY